MEHGLDAVAFLETVAAAEDLESLERFVRTAARRLARSDGATFVLREDDRCFYADEDSIAPLWKGQRFPMHECISGWAMLHDEPAVVVDITLDPRIPQAVYRPTYVRSLVMVPVGSPPIAAIGVYWAARNPRAHAVLPVLRDLARQTAERLEVVGLEAAPWAPNFASDEQPKVSPA